jgi:hypothetical protein
MGEAEEVRLVYGIECVHRRALNDLVFLRGNAERAFPSVRFRNVRA